MSSMAKGGRPMVPPQEAFIVTIGVSTNNKDRDCHRALRELQRAGFHAGETSHDTILTLAEQVRQVRELESNDPGSTE